MSLPPAVVTASLLAFNRQMLDAALALVQVHLEVGGPVYEGPMGSHLRHVIEHWEALAAAPGTGVVDYDARPRDTALERSAPLARRRLLALRDRFGDWPPSMLADVVCLRGRCGAAGEAAFEVPSTFGRELAFVASHAVHHFALLKPHCVAQGIAIDADFGKAPATVAHERAAAVHQPLQEQPPCMPSQPSSLAGSPSRP